MQLTANFTFEEFVQTSHREHAEANYNFGFKNKTKVQWLAEHMQQLRDCLGSPIVVTSAVRCAALNAAVGGVANSQHAKIEAVDFIVPGMVLETAFDLIRNYQEVPYDQLILECVGKSKWIHISFTPGKPRRQVLKYNDQKYTKVE